MRIRYGEQYKHWEGYNSVASCGGMKHMTSSDFYKTKRWQEIRNRYKQRADFKKAAIAEIQKVIVNGNLAEMEKQNIMQMVSRM